MMTLQHCKTGFASAAVAVLFATTGAFAAGTMSSAEISAAKDRISAD